MVEAEPWGGLGRLIMGIGGGVLIALFFCPWHGVSSWQLLETLAGADFVRQLFYLTGGIVLLACAILPLPFLFRAAVGTVVAAMPVLLGAGGIIEGWRGVVAALAILGLPATHLLRSRAQSSTAARTLVLAAVAAVALLYLLPVSSLVPIAVIFKMMASGVGAAIFALFLLIPLLFAALSLFGVMGRDLTDVAVLLSVLILLWAPVGMALRGMMIEDATQLYVAVGLLWATATAALSLAQLLSLAAARTQASVRARVIVGVSVEGRAIEAFEIAGSNGTPGLGALVFGAIHGDEPGSAELCRRFADALVAEPPLHRTIVIPALNPDGLARQSQEQRARRRSQPQLRGANWAARARARLLPGHRAAVGAGVAGAGALIDRWQPRALVAVHQPFRCVNWDGPAAGARRPDGGGVRLSVGGDGRLSDAGLVRLALRRRRGALRHHLRAAAPGSRRGLGRLRARAAMLYNLPAGRSDMTISEVSWGDLCELHVVKRLGQIVERRLRVAVGYRRRTRHARRGRQLAGVRA